MESSWALDPWPGDIFPLILSKRQDGVKVIVCACKSGDINRNLGLCDLGQVNSLSLSLTHSFHRYLLNTSYV